MKYFGMLVIIISSSGCHQPNETMEGTQSQMVREMIDAVNQKDAHAYVAHFSDTVKVFVEGDLKVNGKTALAMNRSQHFKSHPSVRSEIQYLVEIDNKVIMHDKVWLNSDEPIASDIVETFTFHEHQIVRVDVLQPKELFK